MKFPISIMLDKRIFNIRMLISKKKPIFPSRNFCFDEEKFETRYSDTKYFLIVIDENRGIKCYNYGPRSLKLIIKTIN